MKTHPNKRNDIVEKIFVFSKQQKRRGLKMITPKQILQRLAIALAKVKGDNTSENLLVYFCKIVYSLYQAK